MIITKTWLNEWINIEKYSSEEICKTLNSIGLEVDSLQKIRIPEKIVIGYVKECIKHPNADKLSICQVDVGEEILQIVCGAKNVAKDQFVPVAVNGAVLGENFKIKKAKLRGVESNGMICSSTELGLPEINDGIMELDDSIGELVIGKELKEYALINDDIINIELTANRGDCLSIFGVARDLSAALDIKLTFLDKVEDDDSNLGIGRALSLSAKDDCKSSLLYKIFQKEELVNPLLMQLRLAFVERKFDNIFDMYKNYTIHATGVIIKLYSYDNFINKESNKCEIKLEKDENEVEFIKIGDAVSFVGLDEDKSLKPNKNNENIIFECSYINPEQLSKTGKFLKKNNDKIFYHASRGSEPRFEFGSKYFKILLNKYSKVKWFGGYEIIDNRPEENIVNVYLSKINALIGQEIEKSQIIKILKGLRFEISMKDEFDLISIKIPLFRHDIKNEQDIVEEIVRMIGIDNIQSKPLIHLESNNQNEALQNYNKKCYFRKKASAIGFFETISYLFVDSEKMKFFNLDEVSQEKTLINPVSKELNSLRSSLVVGLIESASRNVKYGKKSIRLFEYGTVFDKDRNESLKISFIFSGEIQRAGIENHGKPKVIDFFTFAQMISSVIGKFDIQKVENIQSFLSPYEAGNIVKEGEKIGYIGRIHLNIEKEFDLQKSYFCEIDFNKLNCKNIIVNNYSKFPSTERDFSFVIPKNIMYKEVKDIILSVKSDSLLNFYPIDRYESEELGDKISLTIKFILQSNEKTLNDEDISKILNPIIDKLKEKDITIR